MEKERQGPLPQHSVKGARPPTGSWRSRSSHMLSRAGSWRSSRTHKKASAAPPSSELPTTGEGRVIVVVRIEAHDEEKADDSPPAWLPTGYGPALRANSDWLNERTLRRLVRDINRFAEKVHLGEEDPDCCPGEEYLPLLLFVMAFLLVSITAVFAILDWGSILFPSGSLALMMFALGLCSFCICLRRQSRVIMRGPEALCSDFASVWTASNKLPLSFHLRTGGPSYFELKRPESPPRPMLDLGKKEEDKQEESEDDGWSSVMTPTATSSTAAPSRTSSAAPSRASSAAPSKASSGRAAQ